MERLQQAFMKRKKERGNKRKKDFYRRNNLLQPITVTVTELKAVKIC